MYLFLKVFLFISRMRIRRVASFGGDTVYMDGKQPFVLWNLLPPSSG
jgi:hypothetical protein